MRGRRALVGMALIAGLALGGVPALADDDDDGPSVRGIIDDFFGGGDRGRQPRGGGTDSQGRACGACGTSCQAVGGSRWSCTRDQRPCKDDAGNCSCVRSSRC